MMFYILISLFWPSAFCTLFLIYHFIRLPQLRNKLRNRIIFFLLIINFVQEIIELPPRLYFLYTRTVIFPNPIFCQLWNWSQFSLISINQFITAMASIEQYLFIFHRVFLTQHKILLCQLPLVLCILFPIIFFGISVYIPSCITIFYYTRMGCGSPCLFSTNQFALIFKNIVINSFPVIIIIIFNILIIIRVFIQRKKMNRQRHYWYENIRMICQLLPLAILYLIIWIPMCVLFYFSTLGIDIQKSSANILINDYFGNLKYLINYFCPFFILMGQTELHRKIKKIFGCSIKQQTAVVAPLTIKKY